MTDYKNINTNRKPSIKSELYQGVAFVGCVLGCIFLYALIASIKAAS